MQKPIATIREARVSDAAALAILAEATFRETFQSSNTKEDMDLHCAEHFGVNIQSAEILTPAITTFVAEHQTNLVGFAQLALERPARCVSADRPSELHRIYIASSWQGTGLASRLLAAVLSAARGSKSDYIWLGVWEHNPKAIAFYLKAGFAFIGNHEFVLGRDRQRDRVMGLPL